MIHLSHEAFALVLLLAVMAGGGVVIIDSPCGWLLGLGLLTAAILLGIS